MADRYREQIIRAYEFVPDISNGPSIGTRKATTLQGAHYDYLAYDDVIDEYAVASVIAPDDIDTSAGEIKYRVYWETASTTTSQYCQWQILGSHTADGETIDFSPSGNLVTDFVNSSANYLQVTNATTFNGLDGTIRAGDLVMITVRRNGDGDTLVGDANFIGLGIQWKLLDSANGAWT